MPTQQNDDELVRATLAAVAPGTELRDGLERILRGRTGALIVLGNDKVVETVSTGGFPLDIEFSATRLRELAKMDGGIVCDREVTRILRAATQLVPDPRIETSESGTRHRTAERVAKQTGFPVISVSQSMRIIALYIAGRRVVLEDSSAILSRANQALQTLERYKSRLDEVTGTLSALEIEDLVTVRDVANVLQRLEMVRRIKDEIAEYVVQLGTDGRLLSLQLEELTGGLSDDLGPRHPRLPARGQGRLLARGGHRQPRGHRLHRAARPGRRGPRGRLHHRRRLARLLGEPARPPPAVEGAAPARGHRRPPGLALRQPAEAARRQHRRPDGRRRRR